LSGRTRRARTPVSLPAEEKFMDKPLRFDEMITPTIITLVYWLA
jgi:hypothetical protein